MKKGISVFLCLCMIFSTMTCICISAKAEISDGYTYNINNGSAIITGYSETSNKEITIPSSLGGCPVTTIGAEAFAFTDLVSVIIPDTVTSIESSAFSSCYKLENIVLPDSLTYISAYAFEDSKYLVNSNNWENGVLYIGNCLISADDNFNGFLEKCSIKSGTRLIAEYAFESCYDLTNITIPDSVEYICENAFYDCEMVERINYLGTVDQWCNIVFYNQGSLPFYWNLYINNSKLKTATIKNTSINNYAFAHCESLNSLTISANVTRIDENAFYEIDGLEKVTLENCNLKYDRYTFLSTDVIKNHKYKLIKTVKSTCSSKGYKQYKCSNCGYTKKVYTAKISHKTSKKWKCIRKATYFQKGIYVKKCTSCGKVFTIKYTSKKNFKTKPSITLKKTNKRGAVLRYINGRWKGVTQNYQILSFKCSLKNIPKGAHVDAYYLYVYYEGNGWEYVDSFSKSYKYTEYTTNIAIKYKVCANIYNKNGWCRTPYSSTVSTYISD